MIFRGREFVLIIMDTNRVADSDPSSFSSSRVLEQGTVLPVTR